MKKEIVPYLAELRNEVQSPEDCFQLETEHVCRVEKSPCHRQNLPAFGKGSKDGGF